MKILIAVQDKQLVEEMVSFLKAHTWPEQSEFKVIHVIEHPYGGYFTDLEAHERVHARAEEMVASIVEKIEKAAPTSIVEGKTAEGDAKEEIINLADSIEADLIVMGSHGRGVVGRLFLGSVSLAVVAAAPCSVVILRKPRSAS